MTARLHVVAAALVDDDGRVLINQRLPGTPMQGRWEFPGGKVEPGESAQQALIRELHEELGVVPSAFRPLMHIRHDYAERKVLLDTWLVSAWSGDVTAREGHPLAWVAPDALREYDLLEADRPLVSALRLPGRYAITAGAPDLLADENATLVQLRTGHPGKYAAAIARAQSTGRTVLINGTPEQAMALDADGVHLTAKRLLSLTRRPLPAELWVAASCHDARELAHARDIGCDFAVLGPVKETTSHPNAKPLGWPRFAELSEHAGLPVYALGGMTLDDLETAWAHGAQGIAGITAFK